MNKIGGRRKRRQPINKKYINSPGQRPMACQTLHQLLLCSSVVFSSLVRDTCPTVETTKSASGTFWPDFPGFLVVFPLLEKTHFFRSRQNRPRTLTQSTLRRPWLHFGPNFIDFGSPFSIDFPTFSKTCKSTFGAYSFTHAMVFDHQKPLIFRSKFH